jgi:hypothetical protein
MDEQNPIPILSSRFALAIFTRTLMRAVPLPHSGANDKSQLPLI